MHLSNSKEEAAEAVVAQVMELMEEEVVVPQVMVAVGVLVMVELQQVQLPAQ